MPNTINFKYSAPAEAEAIFGPTPVLGTGTGKKYLSKSTSTWGPNVLKYFNFKST